VLRLLGDAGARAAMKRDMADVREQLGAPGAIARAAEAILADAQVGAAAPEARALRP
jgi:hypothetical protein